MDIFRRSLDDIFRPRSAEQPGSRLSSMSLPQCDRICSTSPVSRDVLTDDAADLQSSSEETRTISSTRKTDKGHYQADEGTDDVEEHVKLQRAIEEMRRLDEILLEKICNEKEMKRQRKELQAKLWQELRNRHEGRSECAHEALNTRLFLALEAPSGSDEEDDFVPVFETQVPDCEKRPIRSRESSEVSHVETGGESFEGSQCGAFKGKKKRKDFLKMNIELVSGEGEHVHLTQAEKELLDRLLQEVNEEEEESARGTDSKEDVWAVSVLTGQGYTPEPSDLEQLIHIDSKIRLLLPTEEFLSVQSSYTNLSLSQGHGSELCWKCDRDPQPGEKVLQEMKARRGMERRLREIQQQLDILGRSQEMTNESPDLTEEQLLGLLGECELTESWTRDPDANDETSWRPIMRL